LSESLKEEGIARELVNRIQSFRKEKGLEVTDKIKLKVEQHNSINAALNNNKHYICAETLAVELELVDKLNDPNPFHVEIDNGIETTIAIEKIIS